MMKKPPALVVVLLLTAPLWTQSRDEASGGTAPEAAPPEGIVRAAAAPEAAGETAAEALAAAASTASTAEPEDAPELDIETLLRRRVTETAREYLGVPYRYAGITPEGFDCTGFIFFIYREAASMELPRSSAGIWNGGSKIVLAQVKPGDVLVFTTVRPGASHAGIVLENGPEGITFIHAASQGSKTGVIISNMNESYYKTRFMGARSYF
jgi:cell wall-associated NlpC family hydrolase